jgi:hypothetical protein
MKKPPGRIIRRALQNSGCGGADCFEKEEIVLWQK